MKDVANAVISAPTSPNRKGAPMKANITKMKENVMMKASMVSSSMRPTYNSKSMLRFDLTISSRSGFSEPEKWRGAKLPRNFFMSLYNSDQPRPRDFFS